MLLTRRDLLAAALATAAAPAYSRHAAAPDVPRFALGIASGHPRPDGMVLWTRLTGDDLPERVPVRWQVAADEGFRRIVARGAEVAERDWAHSVHAEPRGLAPGRSYWYRFEALGQRSEAGRTLTAPAPDAAATLRFALASCQRWDHGHYAALRHLAADAPDLVVFVGDYIYEYASPPGRVRPHAGGNAHTLADYRARYAQYKGDPALRAAHAASPWLLVWDDHEVENDYAGLEGAPAETDFAARRAAAYQAYWEHQPFPKHWRPRGPEMRIYHRTAWGRLAQIHAVDDRQYRDPHLCGGGTVPRAGCPALDDPRRSMLGAAQERWLAEGWDASRPWNLLAQQTLMAPVRWSTDRSTERVWTDGWEGYGPARARLLDALNQRRVPNAVVLGGDVHTNYVADLHADLADPASPIVASEFCGTSVTSWAGIAQERLDAMRPLNPHLHHVRADERGYVRFTLDAQRLQAELRVVDDVMDPASAIRTSAAFVVEAGRPGVQPA